MPPQLRLNPRRSAECEGALFFGLLSNFTTDSARQAYWPPILQTSSTLGNEPLKSVKSHTVIVEMELLRRAPTTRCCGSHQVLPRMAGSRLPARSRMCGHACCSKASRRRR